MESSCVGLQGTPTKQRFVILHVNSFGKDPHLRGLQRPLHSDAVQVRGLTIWI